MDFNELCVKLESEYPLGIPRGKLKEVTGGILNGRSMANRDSLGNGINGRFYIGRKTVYPVQETVDYIKAIVSKKF